MNLRKTEQSSEKFDNQQPPAIGVVKHHQIVPLQHILLEKENGVDESFEFL